MKSEQLIAKKVKHHFNQKLKQVLFDVISLEEHYDGLLIHKSDIIYLEEGELVNGYVKVGDVNMDDAVSKEFVEKDVLEIEVTAETLELNPELIAEGIVVGETITVDAVEPISEVAKTIEGSRIVKADYVFAAMPTEEIIPEKVVKKKITKKQ
jgi:hypothetical protein